MGILGHEFLLKKKVKCLGIVTFSFLKTIVKNNF